MRRWGARRSWFLVNGASQGNHATLMALAHIGKEVVVQRNVHSSVIDGLVLSGLRPTFVSPEMAFMDLTAKTEVLAIQAAEPGPVAQCVAGIDFMLCALQRGTHHLVETTIEHHPQQRVLRGKAPIHRGHAHAGFGSDILHRRLRTGAGKYPLRGGDDARRIAHRIGAQGTLACGHPHIIS